jgi:Ca2+-binding EF-hand superfamily protein
MNARLIAVVAALAIAHLAAATTEKSRQESSSRPAVAQTADISLTKSQAEAAGMMDVVQNFEKIDANNDGVITRGELRAYLLATRRHVPMT